MVMIQGDRPGQRAGTDDDELMARLRAGDDIAFRALVDRHRPWLVRLCTRLLGYDAHAAEDAAQESLLKLHAAARQNGRPLRVRPWLAVVARNTCVDEQRRRRPDLPGELPERAAPGEDLGQFDPALADAWARLADRHREVLHLREVLGFSYKEIAAVMDLTMPATETLVFRARGALRREYERSGASGFGCGLFGLRLARLGLGRRRDGAVADGLSNAAVNDAGLSGFGSRWVQFLSTSLPGCGEQTVAKILSVAAGAVMAAASVIPGLAPFGNAPPAGAAVAPPAVSGQPVGSAAFAASTAAALGAGSSRSSGAGTGPVTLKGMLGDAAPPGWAPHRAPAEATPGAAGGSSRAGSETRPRVTPLREAAAAARPGDASTLKRPARRPAGTGPLRSLLPAPPDTVQTPERPSQPVRSLVADPVPVSTDQVPADAVPSPTPVPDSAPPVPETFQPAKDRLQELPTAVGPAPDQRPPRPGILPLR